MTKLLTVFIALSSSVALAKFTAPKDVDGRADAPSSQVFQAGSDAAVELTFQGSDSGFGDDGGGDDDRSSSEGCSGTAISSDGYVLTALHCLSTCSSALSKHSVKGGVYYQTDVAKIQNGSVSCSVSVRFNNKGSLSGRAQVVAAGRGFIEQGNPGVSPAVKALVDSGIGPINDYAIIKFKRNPAAGCLKTSPHVAVGEKVWNMAYPSATSRGDGADAPGDKLMFSSGVINQVGDPLQDTIDLVPGSSGSGLFDYNGQLIALSNSVAVPPETDILETEVVGAARSTTISHILSDASSLYGSGVVNQAFNCY